MLRKLIKHEFRATGRVMLPLFLVLLVTSVGANFSVRGMLDTRYKVLDVLGGLLVMAFAVAIFGVCVMSVVLMVQRFYKNLLQDEGYVMMTLPVSVHQHIWSKLIVSAVWFALTVVVVCLAACIVAFDVGFVQELVQGFRELFREISQYLNAYYAINGTVIILEFLAICFVGCCVMCLQFYASLAIGHSFPNHKMAWSVLWFFAAPGGQPVRPAGRELAPPPADGLDGGLAPLRHHCHPADDADRHPGRGPLRRGLLFLNNLVLEKAPEPGVN